LIKIRWAKQPFQIGMDKGRSVIVYALIYDTRDPIKREKKVISLHKTRETAERALEKRMRKLGKRVWECDTRIVWVYNRPHVGDYLKPDAFDTWAPGEEIPYGDSYSDGD
jgi:hypothetical protein